MLPPRLLRRVVLAPLVIALAVSLVVLSPLIALLAVTFSLARRSPSGRMRGVRLLLFALAWLTAETATLFMCLGLWMASGFGGSSAHEVDSFRPHRRTGASGDSRELECCLQTSVKLRPH